MSDAPPSHDLGKHVTSILRAYYIALASGYCISLPLECSIICCGTCDAPTIHSISLAQTMASSNSLDLTLASTVDILAPGVSMPRLGFGIYRVQPSETVEVVLAALDAGYRHFDSAQLYNNEAELGKAIRQSGVARENVFLTTKIRYPGMNKAKTWKKVIDSVRKISGAEVTNGRKRKRGDVRASAEEQADAGKEYVDLFLVHTPYGGPNAKKERREMWLALERAFEEGKARAIGVSNYKVEHLEEMRQYAKVWPPHVNQVQVGIIDWFDCIQ